MGCSARFVVACLSLCVSVVLRMAPHERSTSLHLKEELRMDLMKNVLLAKGVRIFAELCGR